MRPLSGKPANDPHAPGSPAPHSAAGPDVEARLERLLADRRTQRMLGDDARSRALMRRVAHAVRRGLAETPSGR